MDFSFPSLLSGLVIGSLGLFLFLVGKRSDRPVWLVLGLAMCVYPYFIANLVMLWALTAVLLVPIWTTRHT